MTTPGTKGPEGVTPCPGASPAGGDRAQPAARGSRDQGRAGRWRWARGGGPALRHRHTWAGRAGGAIYSALFRARGAIGRRRVTAPPRPGQSPAAPGAARAASAGSVRMPGQRERAGGCSEHPRGFPCRPLCRPLPCWSGGHAAPPCPTLSATSGLRTGRLGELPPVAAGEGSSTRGGVGRAVQAGCQRRASGRSSLAIPAEREDIGSRLSLSRSAQR